MLPSNQMKLTKFFNSIKRKLLLEENKKDYFDETIKAMFYQINNMNFETLDQAQKYISKISKPIV